ncbi:MAG: hypothetical protein EZS28_043250, partial [Streblomastix strix]
QKGHVVPSARGSAVGLHGQADLDIPFNNYGSFGHTQPFGSRPGLQLHKNSQSEEVQSVGVQPIGRGSSTFPPVHIFVDWQVVRLNGVCPYSSQMHYQGCTFWTQYALRPCVGQQANQDSSVGPQCAWDTYQQLYQFSTQIGQVLMNIGCKIGENIGVISRPCKEKLAVSCACLAHGFCFVNIPQNLTSDALILMIKLSKYQVIFLSASLLESLKEKLKQAPMLRVVFVFDDQKYEQIH